MALDLGPITIDPSEYAAALTRPVAALKASDYPNQTDYSSYAELLRFDVYDRSALETAALSGDAKVGLSSPNASVVMPVNPSGVEFSQGRIVEKVRTLGAIDAPNRTRNVILDYGPDLAVMRIQAQTGNLQPKKAEAVSASAKASVPSGYGSISFDTIDLQPALWSKYANSYSAILQESPRHAAFMALLGIYQTFSANDHVMLMTFMGTRLRGHIEDFSYPMQAEKPWNIHYTFNFVIVAGMGSFTRNGMGSLVGEGNIGPLNPLSFPTAWLSSEAWAYFDDESQVLLLQRPPYAGDQVPIDTWAWADVASYRNSRG